MIMNTNENDKCSENGIPASVGYTLALCKKAAALIEQTKAAIVAEFQDGRDLTQRLLRLAVNEAEALAWETDYPQLLFPALAAEKAAALADWRAHQRNVKETQRALAA